MTSTNDGKDVNSNQSSGPKGKTYYIELYKSLEARLSEGGAASERTKPLCEAWRRVHTLCQHSAPSTHPHLLAWLQRHTARAVLQTEWQTEKRKDDRESLEHAIDGFLAECEAARVARGGDSASWESQLAARGEWFKRMLGRPWDHPVLTLLLNPNGAPPTDDEVLEWLREERGVTFVMRLHTLVGEKCDDIAMSLANAVMDRVRSALPPVSDTDEPEDAPPEENPTPTFGDRLKEEAGFTADVWETITDIEFVLLHKRDSKRCIALAKQTPLLSAYHLIERLQKRLEVSPREKRLWKNAKEVAILIAQVVIARCMMAPCCSGAARTALYCCARLLARMLAARLPAAADALANQAPTARHLHTLAQAIDKQLSNTEESMKPYVCELYVRAITAGMNELERLKLKTEKEAEARLMEKSLASWFVQLGAVLSRSERIVRECTLTAFSLHPSQHMYERLHAAPAPAPPLADSDEIKDETVKSEFGSWACDSRSQTNFVKTSETLKMKHTQNQANVMSTAIFNEGEALGLSPELCQDIAVLLSGPRVKTLSWDMDRTLLLENCRAHSEKTHGGTRVLTRELKYLNIDPTHYQHLPEDVDDDENDPYYGIERGYEHLIPEDPEEIWEDANDPERTETAASSVEDEFIAPRRKIKTKQVPLSSDEDSDPLSFMAEAKRIQKKKERPHSKERSKERAKKKQEPVDPLDINSPNIQNYVKKDKPKKERKKKEKAPKDKAETKNSLASLVGVKVGKKNKKTVITTRVIAPVTDSDYDSQGKCSLTSMNSEGNDQDGQHEDMVSIEELNSSKRQNSCNLDNMGIMNKNEYWRVSGTGEDKFPMQTLQQPLNNVTRPPYIPSIPNVIRGQSPSQIRNLSPIQNRDVRSSLTKLLDIRRQRAAMELALKRQNTPRMPPKKPAILNPDITIQTNVSPKFVAIPDIPKSYIKNQVAEKMAEISREVENIPGQKQEKRVDTNDSVIQYARKNDGDTLSRTNTPATQAFTLRSGVQQSNTNSLKMTDFVNVPYDRLMAEISERHVRSNYDIVRPPQPQHQLGQLQRSHSVLTPGQRDYQNFLKEYERAKNAMSDHALDMSAKRREGKKEIMPISRVVPVIPNVKTKPEAKTPQCAKQSTLQKKPDTSLNTFSRLSYMHKNKQTESKNKNTTQKTAINTSTYQEISSELDEIIKEHQLAQMKVKQIKNDRLQTAPLCGNTANPQKPTKTAKDHPLLSNMLQKHPSTFSNTTLCRNESSPKHNETPQDPVTSPKTSLTDKDQDDILNLLRQQNKINNSVAYSTNINSKPSTSKSNYAVKSNISPMTDYNSTSGQKQQLSEPVNQPNTSYQSILETKLINIISNTLIKQQNRVVNTENCESMKTSSALSLTKSVKAADIEDKIKKNITNKDTAKKNPVKCIQESEKPEWQSVMSDLLRHKTPTRGPNALDVALNKSSFELAFEKSLQEPSIFASKPPTSDNNLSVKKQIKSDPPKTATGLAHNVIITNKGLSVQTPKPQKAFSDTKAHSKTKKLAISKNEKIVKPNQSVIAKKLPQDVQRKQFTYAVPKHNDPFISGIPNSDYDLLEELMDDDLRKEIGELSSDDESYNVAAQSFLKSTKVNEKRVSVEFNKPLHDTGIKKPATGVQHLNTRHLSHDTMPSTIKKPVIQHVNKITQMTHGSNTIKMPQNSEKAANYKLQDNIHLKTSTSQSTPAYIPTAPNTQNQAYSNVKTLAHNQVVIDPNIYISAVTQQTPLQNVMLIGPELIYETYSAIQTPVHSVSNIPSSAYVAVNNAPSMTLYQPTQFAAPVARPLIIGNSLTVPIINKVPSASMPMKLHLDNMAQSAHPVAVKSETLILDSQKGMERAPEVDIPSQNKPLDGNRVVERKILSEVQKIAINEKTYKTRNEIIEFDTKKSSANEERLKKKRLAIINRKILHRCRDEPIPLSYSPLPVKTPTVSKKHFVSEAIPLTYTPLSTYEVKQKTSDFEAEKLITQIKNNLQDLSDSINDIKSPATPDSTESKENKSLAATPCRRILLRSSNKIIAKSNAESVVLERTTNKKSKAKLKSDIAESTAEVCDKPNQIKVNNKEVITPKRVSKRIRNKTLTIAKEDKTPSKDENNKSSSGINLLAKGKVSPALSRIINDAAFDIETELLGSKISKLVIPSELILEKSDKCEDYELVDFASAEEAKDFISMNCIPQKTIRVPEFVTNMKTEKIINEKINNKIVNSTNEQVDEVSKDKNTDVISPKVSNTPASDSINVNRENSTRKNAKPSKISILQKTKDLEYTTDNNTISIDGNLVIEKYDEVINDRNKQFNDISEIETCFNTNFTKKRLEKPSCDHVIEKLVTSNKNNTIFMEMPPCYVVIEKSTIPYKSPSKDSDLPRCDIELEKPTTVNKNKSIVAEITSCGTVIDKFTHKTQLKISDMSLSDAFVEKSTIPPCGAVIEKLTICKNQANVSEILPSDGFIKKSTINKTTSEISETSSDVVVEKSTTPNDQSDVSKIPSCEVNVEKLTSPNDESDASEMPTSDFVTKKLTTPKKTESKISEMPSSDAVVVKSTIPNDLLDVSQVPLCNEKSTSGKKHQSVVLEIPCDIVIEKSTTRNDRSDDSEMPACDIVVERSTTTSENESKPTSDAKDFSIIKSVRTTASDFTSVNDTIEQSAANLHASEAIDNYGVALPQSVDDLPEKESIDLDMTVTCEEVKVSKTTSTFANIKIARKKSYHVEKNDDAVITSDKIKKNQTLAPTSSDINKAELSYETNKVDPALASFTITNNQRIESADLEVQTDTSPILENNKTVKKVSIRTENEDDIVIINDEITPGSVSPDVNYEKTELFSKNIEVPPAQRSTTIINKCQEKLSDREVPNETPSEVTTSNITANNEVSSNVIVDQDDKIIIVDEDSDTVFKPPGPLKHDNESSKKNNVTSKPTDVNDVPQSLKDSIHIEILPSDDPLKKSVRVSLPNGRKVKATVYGEVHVTFDTLFTYPSIKAALLNGLECKKLYTMNIKQVTTLAKNDPSKILSAQILDIKTTFPTNTVETIDLLSDDEDGCPTGVNVTEEQAFETEYGKYKISPIDDDVFLKHQNQLRRKSMILLEKVDSISNDEGVKVSKNVKTLQNNLLQSIPDQYVTGLINDIQKKLSSEKLNLTANEVVEIDDSSNDSCNLVDDYKYVENTQPDKTINKLKNVLITELGVKEITSKNLQDNQNEMNKTRKIEKSCCIDDSCRLSGMRKLSDISTDECCPFVDLTKKEQRKITNRECYIKLIRCDDLPQMLEITNRNAIEQLSVPIEVSDDESSSSNVPDDDSLTIIGDFSVLDDLDTNIVESEVRSSSPVIELLDGLVSLGNKSLSNNESAVQQVISFLCEANWFTTKPMLHYQGLKNNLLATSNIFGQNFNEISETTSNSATPCMTNGVMAKSEPTHSNCVPSLMSLALKYLKSTDVVRQYSLLRRPCRHVCSLKRRSISLKNYIAYKVPKLNDKISGRKQNDSIFASTVTLNSFATDTLNSSVTDFNDAKINVNMEISSGGDKSVETTKNISETVNKISDEIYIPPSISKYDNNQDEKQGFVADCYKSLNTSESISNLQCDMETKNIISDANSIIAEDYKVSLQTMIVLDEINNADSNGEGDKTEIGNVSEVCSPSPVLEVAHEISPNTIFISKDRDKADIASASNVSSSTSMIEITQELSPEMMIICKDSDKLDIDRASKACSPSPVVQEVDKISLEAIITSNESNKADIENASEGRPFIPVLDVAHEMPPDIKIIAQENNKPDIDIGSKECSPCAVIEKVDESSEAIIISKESHKADIDRASAVRTPLIDTDQLLTNNVTKSNAHILISTSMLELEKTASECNIERSDNCLVPLPIANRDKVIDAPSLEVETILDKPEKMRIDENSSTSLPKQLANTSLESEVTSSSDTSKKLRAVDYKNTVSDDCDSIESRLAEVVGDSLIDPKSNKQKNQAQEFKNLFRAYDNMNVNNGLEINSRGNETGATSRITLDDDFLAERGHKIPIEENTLEKCFSVIADHEYAISFSTSLLDHMNENDEQDHEIIYVNSHDMTFLLEDEPTKELEEEVIEMHSDEIINDILFDNGVNKISKDEIKVCHLASHYENKTVTIHDNCSSQIKEPKKTENLEEIVLKAKEYYNFKSCNKNVSTTFDDDCFSQVKDELKKNDNMEDIVLSKQVPRDLLTHFNLSKIVDDDKPEIKPKNVVDFVLDEKEFCDLVIHKETISTSFDENCSSQAKELEITTKILDEVFENKNVESTSKDIGAETILNKYLTLIGGESKVLEGVIEYEDPEAGTCYVIPIIENCQENENTDQEIKTIIRGIINNPERVTDERINSGKSHKISQSPPIEVNKCRTLSYDNIEKQLAKIVGEPLMTGEEENIEKATPNFCLDEKYKSSYSVEVEAICRSETNNDDVEQQLMGNSDQDDVNQKSLKTETFTEKYLGMDENLKVIMPKRTYAKATEHIRQRRKSLKRKWDMSDMKTSEKKYRKGKNIDYPKITAVAMSESGYAKEYKRLIDYCSTVKFSFAIPFHKDYIDVHNTLKSWPIENRNSAIPEDLKESKQTLFADLEKTESLLDPLEQTLSDEIISNYDENSYTPSNIDETNFNMGFGEGSGRVIQEFIDGEHTTFSAATLSDVKQLQPLLPSYIPEVIVKLGLSNEQHDQLLKTRCFVDHLNLREKVRSFFKKTREELISDFEINNEKKDIGWNDSDWPFSDLASPTFIRPSPIEITVKVVQVGQSPVSAAAQNPVTCDPRVTHVSNVSPQCSPENRSGDELQTTIKTEYTELTTANITLPLMQEYAQHHHSIPLESQEPTNTYGANDAVSMSTQIKSVVKIELMEETLQETVNENTEYEYNGLEQLPNGNVNNDSQYQFNHNASNVTESNSNAQDISYPKKQKAAASFSDDKRQKDTLTKSDQIVNAMSAAGISETQAVPKPNNATSVDTTPQNLQSDVNKSQANTNNYSKSTPITAMALQQALSQILPPPLNQTNSSENNQQPSNPPVLHIVQGNNAQSVINKPNGTQLLHIVQNKSAATTNGIPTSQQNTFSGLSLVDGAIQQNGNQVLHIVNTGNQKNSNAGQLLKRVNLLTNLANVQGSNEQKMVQFVCKSADGKSIQLPHQRSMVLRLQPLDPSNVPTTPKQNEAQELPPSSNTAQTVHDKEPNPQEMKSRSLYEENYAKFVQNGDSKPNQEKATSLPKFNQVFGKQVYQDKQNEMNSENLQENSECPTEENNAQLEQINNNIGSPPMLIRKSQTQSSQAQPNLVQQVKQTVGHSNIQTMHGGVIYTRQIPVNLGNGQTINLITVPSTEMVDDSAQKQKADGKFGNQEDPPVIKIVPTNQPTTTASGSTEDNAQVRSTNEVSPQHNPQPQPVLTQMRIKLPMLSKAPQMVGGARVVRPAFFQIQRNVIGGANQQVYQQLVLTAAPPLGQSIRVPMQAQKAKTPSETQSSPESQMSSSTLEQLREFDMVLEQVKERSTVQPGTSTSATNNIFPKSKNSPDTTDNPTPSTSTKDSPTPVLYSVGNTQPLNMVNYVNRKSTITSTTSSSFVRSPDSSGVSESPSSSTHVRLPQTVTSDSCASSSCASEAAAATPVQPKPKKKKSKPSTSNSNPFNIKNTPKPSTQKPLEDEQTTQRILYILAEYKEQVENSPDKDKPAPRRRNNPAAPNAGSSKRKKSSSGSRRRDMSPVVGEDSCRTMGSEDSSCGTSMGECNECLETHSPEESPRKVVRRLTFEQETHTHITQTRTIPQRNVIVADGQAFAVRGATGKPATTVLMPANYLLPVSMVKGGQQIAIVTNRGPKLLVGAGEGGGGGTLLFQRLIGPGGLKPVLARPGVRHIRLPTAALHNLQAFNIATPATNVQPPDSTASPAPATTPPDLVDGRAMSSPWQDREAGEIKPERGNSSPEGSEPWNLPSSSIADDYGYEEIVRTDNMDRTVLDAIPDRYSPDMEAQRIFDKMFDSDSKKSMYDSRCGYDIDASDDDKAYHQVVQRRDGRHTRLTHVSSAAMRHKCAILEHELRLQKSLSEECEDLGVDSPSASELFPEAELLFAPSPAHEQTIDQCHTPLPTVLAQGIPQPDLDDQIATDHLITHKDRNDDLDINLEDVGEIVTVGEDGMTTIPFDQDEFARSHEEFARSHEEFARSHEEFARSHPNTTFHSEPEDGEIPPFTIAQGIKGRHVSFHARGVPGTVVMAPQTTVISQATVEASGAQNTVKFTDIDNMINAMPSPQHPHNINVPSVLVKDRNEGLTKFDRLLNESRELHISNTASAIVHSTGNGTQVIRRVHYETRRDARYAVEDRQSMIPDGKMASNRDSRSAGDTDTSSSERHPDLFWESGTPVRPDRRRYEASSDSDKCCRSPSDEANSNSSGIRLDSVIKAARTERRRSGSSTDDGHPPTLRTYPPKRAHQQHQLTDLDRSVTGKTRAGDRCHEARDSRRRASNRGVVKRGCHCCNGSTAPPKPKKSRPKKSNDYYHSHS